ncbi:MAG TPA: HAMP domain-containing sensor histidine kinase [Gaiellaceae bacterium]|nr:HAMP domain-containing sensor histidine kinase [Gaiellaceae bacterium]
MTLRARLTLSAALAVAVAVVLASIAVYFVVKDELREEVDASLLERASTIDRGPFSERFPRIPAPVLGGPGGYVQLVTADGATLRQPGATLELPVDERTVAVAAGERGPFLRDATVSGTHVRVVVVPFADGVALQIARPLTEVDDVLAGLRWILLAIAAGGSALAALLGLAVAQSALGPTRRLTEAAEEITATRDLARRVETDREDELGRLAVAFNTMLAALESSVDAQRRLVADASHELRTPLTSLRTNVEILGRAEALSPDERRQLLTDVDAELEELSRLVADVVDLARNGEPEQHTEEIRLDEIVADAVERARRRAPQIGFDTALEESVVKGSPERIHRAVANLLDNAIKWSEAGSSVEVRVASAAVTVRDHGPGIAAEDLPFVFDRFYRAPSARGLPGSGLGLAIVRQVAESHGGSVSARQAEGGGTVVTLQLIETP